MSVSEWKQAKPAHHERPMPLMNEVHETMPGSSENLDCVNNRKHARRIFYCYEIRENRKLCEQLVYTASCFASLFIKAVCIIYLYSRGV